MGRDPLIRNVLLSNGLKSILTKKYRQKWENNPRYENKIGMIKIGAKWKKIELISTKSLYLEFLKPMITKPTSIENLEQNLGLQIDEQLWQSFFSRVRKYTQNRHYRILQYKLLHGIHNTKKNLKNGA